MDLMRNRRLLVIVLVVVAVMALAAVSLAVVLWNGSFPGGGSAGSEDVLINEDVVIYDENATFAILGYDDERVVVSSLDGLSEGNILAAGITEETPVGLLRRVNSVEGEEGRFTRHTSQAALTEAIDKCSVSYTVSVDDAGNCVVTNDDAPVGNPFIEQAFAAEARGTLLNVSGGSDSLAFRADDEISISLDIFFGDITMRVVNRFSASAQAELSETLASGKVDKNILPSGKVPLPPFEFFVGPVPVVFDNDVSVDLHAEGEVGVSAALSAMIDKTFGFEYSSSRGLSPVGEDRSSAPEVIFSADSKIYAKADVELSAHFDSLLYGVAGPSITVALKSETEAELCASASADDGAIVLQGTGPKWEGRIFEKISVPITGEFRMAIPGNIFDPDGLEIREELFNTRDAITLIEIDEEYGSEVVPDDPATTPAPPSASRPESAELEILPFEGYYKTKFGEYYQENVPSFSFVVPEGWSIVSDRVKREGALYEVILMQNRSGAEIVFSDLDPDEGGMHNNSVRALVERVGDSSLVTSDVGNRDLGEFMVAKVTVGEQHHNGSGEEMDVDDVYFAVLPSSLAGVQVFNSSFPDVFLAFEYPRMISFYCAVPEGGLSSTDERAVISILSSFREA